MVILTPYVDDVLLAGGNKSTRDILKGKLKSHIKMSDMGGVSRVLRKQVTRDIQAELITINQEDFRRSLLVTYGMQNCRPLGTPEHGKGPSLMQPERAFWTRRRSGDFKLLSAAQCILAMRHATKSRTS